MRALVELKELCYPLEDPESKLTRHRQGKIKHIGLSSISSATLRRACRIAPVAAVQTDYSPFVLDIEGPAGTDLLATCRELGVTVVAAMPLNRGVLTSTFANGRNVGDDKDMRPKMMPRFMAGNREKNAQVVRQFEDTARKLGCTTSQLSLAWLLKQGDDIIPIPGTKKLEFLEENWKAIDMKLSDEDEACVRRFLEEAEIAGHYMPPGFESYAFTDTAEET